jgi:tetratricopeptide (TPR) repeat protein
MNMSERNYDNEAVKRFEKMIAEGISYFFDLEEYLDIIDYYITYGNFNFAHKAIKMGLDQYPENIELLMYQTELLALEGELVEAKKILQFIKNISPDNPDLPLLEADIYSRSNMHEMAVESLLEALKYHPEDTEIYDLLSIEYLYLDQYEKALQVSQKSLDLNPDNQAALYNIVSCFDLMEKNDKARSFLENFIEKHPMSEIGWSLLGKRYLEEKKYEKALQALDYAIAIDDKFLGAYYDKAYVLTKLMRYKEAIEFYKLTLSISDPSAFTYYHIAKNYELLKRYDKAVSYYIKAFYEDPAHYKSRFRHIALLIKLGRINEALLRSYEAVHIIPTQELYEQQAQILLLKNKIEEAIQSLEMSIKLGTLKIPVILLLADLYIKTGEKEKFRALLLEAKKMYPDSKEIQRKMTDN